MASFLRLHPTDNVVVAVAGLSPGDIVDDVKITRRIPPGHKAAVRAITKALRAELLGRPIRVTEVNAGLVETDFSLVRFDGDAEKAKKPYAGIDPLVAEDIADCVAWAVSRPPHVNIDEIVVKPVRQGSTTVVARRV